MVDGGQSMRQIDWDHTLYSEQELAVSLGLLVSSLPPYLVTLHRRTTGVRNARAEALNW